MYNRIKREELGRVEDQMKRITDRCQKQGRGLNSLERDQWNKLASEFETLEQVIRQTEAADGLPSTPGTSLDFPAPMNIEEMADTFRMHPRMQRDRQTTAHDRAFSNFIRSGMDRLSHEDRQLVSQGADTSALMRISSFNGQPGAFKNAQSTIGSGGGYLIPQGFSDQLNEALKYFGGVGVCEEFKTAIGNPWPWPTVNDTGNVGRIIGQNVQVTETDLNFGQVTFGAYIGSSDLVLVPLALMEDSFFDFDALLARLLGTRLGRLRNRMCTVGTGVGQPTGIVPAATAAGNIITFPTGETVSISYNDLVNLEEGVDPAYRESPAATWMFPDAMLKAIKRLVDGNNRPLWQPGLTASFADGATVVGNGRPTILGHPYIVNQDMATPAASSYSILFGDMSRFKIRKVGDLQLLRLVERYADYLQVGFIAFERYDSNLVNQGDLPLVIGQQSAS